MPTSPFSFAWVLPTETVFGPEHIREDEKIAACKYEQTEGDFGALQLDTKNKRDGGLLQATRRQWCWLGYKGVGIFFGQLVGVPTDLVKNILTLMFVARPANYAAQKTTLANTLKVPGFYSTVFIDDAHLNDADAVLEAYGALWSYDPVTHVVGYSDYIVGEDGIQEFAANEIKEGTFIQRLNDAPLGSVIIDVAFGWDQSVSGSIDLGTDFVETYTGVSFISSFPKTGANLQGGYTVEFGEALDVYGIMELENTSFSWAWHNNQKEHRNGDTMSDSGSQSTPQFMGNEWLEATLTLNTQTGINDPYSDPPVNIDSSIEQTLIYVPRFLIKTTLRLGFEGVRQRQERVRFRINANLQPIITMPGDDEPLVLSPGTRPLHEVVPGEVNSPIGQSERRSFLTIPNGIFCLEYLIRYGQAYLKLRSRAVGMEWECSFERAIALRTRMNARPHDDRIPGGSAIGKIVKYGWFSDGNGRRQGGSVEIACCIGKGEAVAEVDGTPVYFAEGFLIPHEYQQYTGRTVVLPEGNVGYTVPVDLPVDDGLDFLRPLTKREVVKTDVITGSAEIQEAFIIPAFAADATAAVLGQTPDQNNDKKLAIQKANDLGVEAVLKVHPVKRVLTLRPITGGPFETLYEPTITMQELPKQIDLAVATAAGRLRASEGADAASVAGTVS